MDLVIVVSNLTLSVYHPMKTLMRLKKERSFECSKSLKVIIWANKRDKDDENIVSLYRRLTNSNFLLKR